MSSSTSNLPTIIVALVLAIILIGFFIADRTSSVTTDVSSITHSAGTDKKISAKAKYERSKSVFEHSGFSGSMEDYLNHSDEDHHNSADAKVVEEHSGYSDYTTYKTQCGNYHAYLTARYFRFIAFF